MEAKIWSIEYWITETHPEILDTTFEEIIKLSGFTILKKLDHVWQPQGYTSIFLLAESHLAIHTFPEESKTYIQLSSCNLEMFNKFVEIMKYTQF